MDSGGVPITPPLTPPQRRALSEAISPDRLRTYQGAARAGGVDVLELYLWDRDLAAAALADIAVLEVALRNAMNTRLAELAGRADWYAVELGLDDRSLRAIAQAWKRLPAERRTPGRVVAQLMFGFWRDLLEQGGHHGEGPLRVRRSYEDLWRAGMHRAFPGGRVEAASVGQRSTRTWTLGVVNPVIALRNRAAHHEPLVNGFPLPGESRRLSVQDGHQACLRLARILDRDLASWLQTHSQLAERLAQRPR